MRTCLPVLIYNNYSYIIDVQFNADMCVCGCINTCKYLCTYIQIECHTHTVTNTHICIRLSDSHILMKNRIHMQMCNNIYNILHSLHPLLFHYFFIIFILWWSREIFFLFWNMQPFIYITAFLIIYFLQNLQYSVTKSN